MAPTRFSTTNCWLNTSESRAQVTRARLSMLPPAANPTSTRTGFCGQFCAKADGAASDAAKAAPDAMSERREMIGMVRITKDSPKRYGRTNPPGLPHAQHGQRCGAQSRRQHVCSDRARRYCALSPLWGEGCPVVQHRHRG